MIRPFSFTFKFKGLDYYLSDNLYFVALSHSKSIWKTEGLKLYIFPKNLGESILWLKYQGITSTNVLARNPVLKRPGGSPEI